MRNPPERAPSSVARAPLARQERVEERTYQFLTPVLGGGADADGKPADPVTPVRSASIRGQLRFWWRACNPQGLADVGALRAAERKIFGAASEPSALVVEVIRKPESPGIKRIFKHDGPWTGLDDIAYGAFPLRPEVKQKAPGVLHEYRGTWTVRFRLPVDGRADPESLAHNVDAALWAWTHFGGLGGRTRRGFGAIAEVGTPVAAPLYKGWTKYVSGIEVPWPHLPSEFDDVIAFGPKYRRSEDNTPGWEAMGTLLRILRELRQGRLGRAFDGAKPKRSYWPEADAIRYFTRRSTPEHEAPVTRGHFFPRAAFGLPIGFRFKDEKNGEPLPTTLVPRGRERWASPLILRPHAEPDDTIRALAVALRPRVSEQLALKGAPCDRDIEGRYTWEQARDIPASPARPSPLVRGSHVFVDPIDRYLDELESSGDTFDE